MFDVNQEKYKHTGTHTVVLAVVVSSRSNQLQYYKHYGKYVGL